MANVLGELFQDIADAIRGKTGSTDTMKPVDFPTAIAGIEAGGGSGGGGSLPAGVYWEQVVPYVPYNLGNYFVTYNGKLCVFVNTQSSSSYYVLYQFDGESYTAISDTLTITYGANCPIEFNGKIHMMYEAKHNVYYNGSVTALNEFPGTCYVCVVWNNVLYGLNYKDGLIYQWDEATDTWTDSGIKPTSKYASGYLFVHNNELYWIKDKTLSKFVDGSTVTVADIGQFATEALYMNGYLYFTPSASGVINLYKYDIDNNVLTNIGLIPYMGANFQMYGYGNSVRINGGSTTYRNHFILHEVTE